MIGNHIKPLTISSRFWLGLQHKTSIGEIFMIETYNYGKYNSETIGEQ